VIFLSKRKPDKLHGIRLELQSAERDLLEQQMYLDFAQKIFGHITSMPLETLYGLLSIAEALDWIDTPIPTISDLTEIGAAISSWASNVKAESQAKREAEDKAREEYARNVQQQYQEKDDYTPTGTDPRTQNYDENYNPSDPVDRYTTNPYTGAQQTS
jgi:hypothetical protein